MLIKHAASINIIRDYGKEMSYTATSNGRLIADQITNDFKNNVRCFNIIGSYGTGKSAFILAYEKSIQKKAKYFDVTLLQNSNSKFINIIGEYNSLRESLASHFEVDSNEFLSQNIFSEIYNQYYDLNKSNKGLLFIIIDEFGKFLEYAVKNNPEKELYFIQELAEFISNADNNIILITTVHQNFDAYASGLNNIQKQEWTKVKGRFRELTFNEPIEQLLYLASEQLDDIQVKVDENKINKSIELFADAKAFRFHKEYLHEISNKLYPLELFSAYTLTSALQKYGQNERSLFSFLESTDHTGIKAHNKNATNFYSLDKVYDYLVFNFYSFLQSLENPNLNTWRAIKDALDKVERVFDVTISEYTSIIKSIGLLNIFAENGAKLDKAFLSNYISICLDITSADTLIDNLESNNIIGYRNYSNRYIFPEATDVDIQSELLKASNKIDQVTDITTLLNKHYQLPPIVAKEASYKTGTPRLFEYIISESPKDKKPEGETDGFINLVFSNSFTIEKLIEVSKRQTEAILYGFYKNSSSIKELLFEIEKTKKVIEENIDDKVAVKELSNIFQHQQNFLNHKILNNFYTPEKEIVWVYKGEKQKIVSKRSFNNILSEICLDIYDKAPNFNNELINKHKLSGSIHGAKRNYLKALVNDWNRIDMGFPSNKFPPEKTIATALLLDNGIRLHEDFNGEIVINNKNNFQWVWALSLTFLESAKVSKRKISEFVDLLSQRPYKLKQGLIDFWIPTFLFIKRNDFALFEDDRYIPYLTPDVLELIIKNPEEYEIKTFDIDGVKLNLFNSYRLFLQQSNEVKPGNDSFIETIKPFLVFYRSLPDYSKNTLRLSKEAMNVRNVISKSKDPELTFFESFPAALGYNLVQLQENESLLEVYTLKLQEAIRELRSSYDELIDRVELFIQKEVLGHEMTFEGYKQALQVRFSMLKKHLLLPPQRKFMQRLDSEIDDKKAWLNSISQSIIGNTLDKLSDDEELMLYDKFKSMILELDSLTQISNSRISPNKEELLSLEISSFDTGLNKKTIRLPKNKSNDIEKVEGEIRKMLSNDASVNLAALAHILKDLMQNGKG